MAVFEGNINDLMKSAFGVITHFPVYIIGDSQPAVKTDTPDAFSTDGAYLFDRFGFDIAEANLSFKNGAEAGKWYLPDATVVDTGVSKNIVQTIMAGRKGSVKELISEGDYMFTFRGFIIGQTNGKHDIDFPREARRQMKQVWAVNKSLRVYSRLINDLDVNRVVVLDLRFPPMEGYENVQPYVLTCLSDDDIVLDLSKQK